MLIHYELRITQKMKSYKEMPIGGIIDKPGSSKDYKTGSWRVQNPVRDTEKCTNCLFCFNFCPEGAWKIKNGKISHVDLDYCKGCGICEKICPVKVIKMEREFRRGLKNQD